MSAWKLIVFTLHLTDHSVLMSYLHEQFSLLHNSTLPRIFFIIFRPMSILQLNLFLQSSKTVGLEKTHFQRTALQTLIFKMLSCQIMAFICCRLLLVKAVLNHLLLVESYAIDGTHLRIAAYLVRVIVLFKFQ